ncbi:MAG: elongation factor G [Clostridia bacterium]|nr:elongation factor G [Clostridia bacterium]
MSTFATSKIRNVCLMGHGGAGKTSLAEAMLFAAKATDRLGKIADGNTVCDFDSEEIRRKVSVQTAAAYLEWKDCKINLLDTPGYFDFAGEVIEAARAADTALIVVPAKNGVEVGTEKAYRYAVDAKIPKAFFISKLDEDNSDFAKTFAQLRETFGLAVCPLIAPIVENHKVVAYFDLSTCKKLICEKDGKTTAEAANIEDYPGMEELRNMLFESVAETSDELMEKFFAGEEFTMDEVTSALNQGLLSGSIAPVLCGSSATLAGMDLMLREITHAFPSPDMVEGVDGKADPNAPTALLVFKTIADPFVGKMSFFKVLSGCVHQDDVLKNSRAGTSEKMGHIFIMRGKKQTEVTELQAGDIGVVTKLESVNTGDVLAASGAKTDYAPIAFPAPCLTSAMMPKARGDEEKISSGVQRLLEEDKTISFENNAETKQLLISGLGETHLDVIVSKLKTKFGVGVELAEPRVAYRETIRKKVKVQGKHKKQSGGHGQYGDVWIEFEPGDELDLVFTESVFGGAVPRNFFPAVEKGLRDSVERGVLAGYPVVNLKANLVDGSYHPVDSSEMAFKTAARLAFKAGMAQANPVLLEPVGELHVLVPSDNMGDIIGDINKRRGRMLGMNNGVERGIDEIIAEVPAAEMNDYAIALRSITQGRGSFTFAFVRYEEVPANVSQKIVEEARKNMVDDE